MQNEGVLARKMHTIIHTKMLVESGTVRAVLLHLFIRTNFSHVGELDREFSESVPSLARAP